MPHPPNPPIDRPWTRVHHEVLTELGVDADRGLDAEEAKRRRRQYGPNRLQEAKKGSAWQILASQFKSLIVVLLMAAAAVSLLFGDWVEGMAIAAVILLNGAMGFFMELKAVRSMEALQRMGSLSARVRRSGKVQEIPALELVPGDIVVVEGGDIVTGDLLLIKASKLQADESALTGESLPVGKRVEPLGGEVPLAERKNMLFKGTALTRGSGETVVVATGMATELGKISSLVEEAGEEVTPLEKRLNRLGHKLVWATLIIAGLIAIGGILSGRELLLMIETSIALAVAAIPEGLPIVATIALARGMWRMAKRNALINRLSAVETLGATTIICTDKTGTLTENRMTVTRIALHSSDLCVENGSRADEGRFVRNGEVLEPGEDAVLREALKAGVLCSNAAIHREEGGEIQFTGDPLEVALLIAGIRAGIHQERLVQEMPEVREEAFDSDIKMMATFNRDGDRYAVSAKGAPESILQCCTHILTEKGEKQLDNEERDRWLIRNARIAEEGLRVLALAKKSTDSIEVQPYEGLVFLGLVGMLDPLRGEVRQAVRSCQEAGIRVIMVTGDQAETARNIGASLGLIRGNKDEIIHTKELENLQALSEEERARILKASIFTRVSPRQKLGLIDIHQRNNAIVAMTGDGVNDAPALKKADIGIAMGRRGTQVAREASDMILEDDSFSTIVVAIEQGRIIFDNIRKFVLFLLSCNVSEVMVVSLASFVHFPLPVLPLQILFLNLVTDVFPALALGLGEGDASVLKRAPRNPRESFLTRGHWLGIGLYGFLITVSVFGALLVSLFWLKLETKQAVTISFLTLAFAQLWHVFNMHDRGSGFFRNEITRNRYIWGALGLCTCLLGGAVYVPGISSVLKVVEPGAGGWLLVLLMSLIPLGAGHLAKDRIRKS